MNAFAEGNYWVGYLNSEEQDDSTHVDTLGYLVALLRFLRPQIVLEAGSYKGVFANSAATVIAEWGGQVITCDPVDHGWTPLPNVVYLQDDFVAIREEYPEVLGLAGFIYVDSGPAYGWAVEHNIRHQHYLLAKEWCAPGGIIAVDDTNAEDWDDGKRICADASIVLHGGRGLALWQRK